MRAPAEITQAVESFDAQGQQGEQPTDQQTVGLVMTDMLETMAALGFVDSGGWEIRQPIGFHHLAIRLVLAIEEHPHGGKTNFYNVSVCCESQQRVYGCDRG